MIVVVEALTASPLNNMHGCSQDHTAFLSCEPATTSGSKAGDNIRYPQYVRGTEKEGVKGRGAENSGKDSSPWIVRVRPAYFRFA